MYNVFIDGREGTTGLQIYERLMSRKDVSLLTLPEELRKDAGARKEMINRADVVFLCLPDDAAREAAGLCENPATKIIDASTAHRTSPGWAYGFPEPVARLSFGNRLVRAHRQSRLPRERLYLDCLSVGFRGDRGGGLSLRRPFRDGVQRRGEEDDRRISFGGAGRGVGQPPAIRPCPCIISICPK